MNSARRDAQRVGWVLYAHVDDMVYAVGDELDPTNARIGTAFQGGIPGDC